KVSQNLHAEILLRLLGREKGTGGTVQAGLEVLRGFLNNAGVPAEEYVFYDGSGCLDRTWSLRTRWSNYCATPPLNHGVRSFAIPSRLPGRTDHSPTASKISIPLRRFTVRRDRWAASR